MTRFHSKQLTTIKIWGINMGIFFGDFEIPWRFVLKILLLENPVNPKEFNSVNYSVWEVLKGFWEVQKRKKNVLYDLMKFVKALIRLDKKSYHRIYQLSYCDSPSLCNNTWEIVVDDCLSLLFIPDVIKCFCLLILSYLKIFRLWKHGIFTFVWWRFMMA